MSSEWSESEFQTQAINPGQLQGFNQFDRRDFTDNAVGLRIPNGDGWADCPSSQNPYDCAWVRLFMI
jgi:hypothetical protein